MEIISKPRLKTEGVYDFRFIVLFHCLLCDCLVPRPYVIYFIHLWHVSYSYVCAESAVKHQSTNLMTNFTSCIAAVLTGESTSSLCVCQGCDIRSGTNERLLTERASVKTLTLVSNRSVSIDFGRFDVIFPYDCKFADCLEEASSLAQHFLSILTLIIIMIIIIIIIEFL